MCILLRPSLITDSLAARFPALEIAASRVEKLTTFLVLATARCARPFLFVGPRFIGSRPLHPLHGFARLRTTPTGCPGRPVTFPSGSNDLEPLIV